MSEQCRAEFSKPMNELTTRPAYICETWQQSRQLGGSQRERTQLLWKEDG